MGEASVAIIIVNWNRSNDTLECLSSLNGINYDNIKVFVVDNCSNDNSYDLFKSFVRQEMCNYRIELLRTKNNMGFAGGNNIAIKKAYVEHFDYIWLLNNDTVVNSNSLKKLIDVIDNNNDIGIVGSKIYYYKTKLIWFAGGCINTWKGKTSHLGLKDDETTSIKYNKNTEVDYITGCSMLFRRNLIKEIGLLNENYFMYYEEVEFNIKAYQKNWKILFVHDSIIYHKVSISSGGENNLAPILAYYDIRNGYMLIKNTQNNFKKVFAYIYKYWKGIKFLAKIYVRKQDSKVERIKYIMKALKLK